MGTAIYVGPTPSYGVWNMRTATFIAPNNGQYISVLMTAGGLGDWVNIDNFTFAIPLPLELLSFTGEHINSINMLQWTIATDTQVDYFDIERSSDGINFDAIGTVQPKNNFVAQNDFAFSDDNPFNGINYYRLKVAGGHDYSDIIAIDNNYTDFVVNLYPNPASAQLHINITGGENNNTVYLMHVTNLQGENILTTNVQQNSTINISNFPAGIYFVTISDAAGKHTLVKQLVKVQAQ